MSTVFTVSSELMDNWRNLSAVSAGKKMQAVCVDSNMGFLSISDDGYLFYTRESHSGAAAFEKTSICGAIRKLHKKDVEIKTFSNIADRVTQEHILIVGAVADKKDYIYLSKNTDLTTPSFIEIPIPADMRKRFRLSECTISSYNGSLSIIVTFAEANGNLERFFISEKDNWLYYPLPANFDNIKDMCHGRASDELVDGIYTLGSNNNQYQLLYVPSRNVFDPEIAPNATRLKMPDKIERIAACLNGDTSYTDLFACGNGKLYLYPYSGQTDLAAPVELLNSKLFNDIKQLYAFEARNRIYVYALNESKQLLYAYADKDLITNKGCWSPVMLLSDGLDYVYPFKNTSTGTTALFGYLSNGNVVSGNESAATGIWSLSEIYVDSSIGKTVQITSYTTKIIVKDEHGNPLAGKEISLKASEQCSVWVNGVSYNFKGYPIDVKTNENGEIKIVEQAFSLSAVKFEVCDSSNAMHSIDPSEKVMDRIYELDTADKLRNASVKQQDGKSEKLVATDVDKNALKAVADSFKSLKQAHSQIKNGNSIANANDLCGVKISFSNGALISENISPVYENIYDFASSSLGVTDNGIDTISLPSLSDVFSYIKGLFNSAFEIAICIIDKAWNFVVNVAGKIVSFVIDCVEKVIACAVEAFNWIKVKIEKIIKFLKFIFDIEDILKVKDVIKKIINVSLDDMKNSVSNLKGKIVTKINEAIKMVEEFGDLKSIGNDFNKKISQYKNENSDSDDVRGTFFNDMLIENNNTTDNLFAVANTETSEMASGKIEDLIEKLSQITGQSKEIVDNLIKRIQNEFINGEAIKNMDLLTILKKLAAIIGTVALDVGKLIVEVVFDIAESALEQMKSLMNYKIHIPIISDFLNFIGISDFSFLDVVAFSIAFLSTVIYKTATGKAPFDKSTYGYIMGIKSLSDLKDANDKAAVQSNADVSKTIFKVLKFLAGTAALIETILSAIFKLKPSKEENIFVFLANLADGILYTAASFTYNPMGKKVQLKKDWGLLFTAVKYAPYAIIGYGFYKKYIKKDLYSNLYSMLGKLCFAITSLLTVAVDIVYIVQSTKFPSDNERTLFIVDTSGLICDNIRNVLDFVLITELAAEPHVRVPVLVIRSVCAAAYAGTQIAQTFID